MLYVVGNTVGNAALQLGEKTATKRQSGITNFFQKVEPNTKSTLSASLPHAKKLRTKPDLQRPSKLPCVCMTCFKYVI